MGFECLGDDPLQRAVQQFGSFLEELNRKVPMLIETYGEPYGLSPLAMAACGIVVKRSNSATLSEIGEAINASPSTMTGVARQLERMGYARRVPSPSDGRVSLLELTDDGVAIVTRVQTELMDDIRESAAAVDEQELAVSLRVFEEMIRVVDGMLAQRAGANAGR